MLTMNPSLLGSIDGRIGSMAEKMGKYSITMPKDLAEAARTFAGDAGLSAFIATSVERTVQNMRLKEGVRTYEAEHGAFTDEEMKAVHDEAWEIFLATEDEHQREREE
jgi:hypothetical protein